MRVWKIWWLAVLGLVLGACSTEGTPQGEVQVTIQGLPQGVKGRVVLAGKKAVEVETSGVYTVEAGTYAIRVESVSLGDGTRYDGEASASTVEVRPRQRARVEVNYREDASSRPGTLVLLVEGLPAGAEASIRVRGEGQEITARGSTTLRLRPGTYLVQASGIAHQGKRYRAAPEQQSVTLAPGREATARVAYSEEVEVGELVVRIEGLPRGREARVSVRNGRGVTVAFLTSSRVLELPEGVYFIEPEDLEGYEGSVTGSPATVRANARTEAVVRYTPTRGVLAVSIVFRDGPPGAEGQVVVSGIGVQISLRQSRVLELPRGIYTITAQPVILEGVRFVPTPAGGTVEVRGGQVDSFNITYSPVRE